MNNQLFNVEYQRLGKLGKFKTIKATPDIVDNIDTLARAFFLHDIQPFTLLARTQIRESQLTKSFLVTNQRLRILNPIQAKIQVKSNDNDYVRQTFRMLFRLI